MSRKYTLFHVVGAFVLGALAGGLGAKKGCPPVPAPADVDPPPVAAPADTSAPGAK